MKTESDHIWMAYLDNELTAGEISEFEENVSAEDLKRLEKERKFETELIKDLPEAKCPDHVWDNIKDDVRHTERRHSSRMRIAAITGIAALIALSFLFVYDAVSKKEYQVLKQVTTLAALGKEIDIKGDDPSRVESLLKSYGFDLELLPVPEKGHKMELLGAYPFKCCPKVKVVALCFSCCGKPVRLVVMKEGTYFVEDCESKCEKGDIQKIVKKGPYRVAVIGEHPADELLNLLQPSNDMALK